MAIVIVGKSTCAICKNVLSDSDDMLLFPAFIHDDADPMWYVSDAAVHRDCFKLWPEASAFRKRFNQEWRQEVPHHLRFMHEDGTIVDET